MRINEIKYLRRFNLGNYEHEEIAVGVSVEEKEDATDVLTQMRTFVHSKGLIAPTTVNEPVVTQDTSPAPEPIPITKKPKKKVEETPEPEPEKAASVVSPELETTKAPEKTGKKFKSKGVTKYDRNLDIHKKMVIEYMDVKSPNWHKDKPYAERVKNASIKLADTDFLDAEGSILPSFKEALDNAVSV